jgi:hypothetical protein
MTIYNEVQAEVTRSRKLHGDFHGAHEGYAVLLEEVNELWDEVKLRKRGFLTMRTECVQIAAMAIKFAEDVCDKKNDR